MVSGTEYETGAVKRAHRVDYDDRLSFRTLAVEDVVILKLIADRPQDESDVVSIIVARPDFDEAYMTRWFDEFDHLDIGVRYQHPLAYVKQRGLLRKQEPSILKCRRDGHSRPQCAARRGARAAEWA